MLAVSVGVSLLLLASGPGWAGGKNRQGAQAADAQKDKEPASFNKTFQWEEKEMGPKTKGVNHAKIAAMQEQGRREDAERRNAPARKAEHTQGVNDPGAPAIPTQDIEKATAVHLPAHKAAQTPKQQPDAIDNVLAENGVGTSNDSGRDGLNKVFGGSSKHKVAAKHAKRAKHRR
jgi:hypothetical protein